jgi:hypothetical protein
MTGGAFTRRAQRFLMEMPDHRPEKPFEPRRLLDAVDGTAMTVTSRAGRCHSSSTRWCEYLEASMDPVALPPTPAQAVHLCETLCVARNAARFDVGIRHLHAHHGAFHPVPHGNPRCGEDQAKEDERRVTEQGTTRRRARERALLGADACRETRVLSRLDLQLRWVDHRCVCFIGRRRHGYDRLPARIVVAFRPRDRADHALNPPRGHRHREDNRENHGPYEGAATRGSRLPPAHPRCPLRALQALKQRQLGPELHVVEA